MFKKTWICILALLLALQPVEAVHAQSDTAIVFPGIGIESEEETSEDADYEEDGSDESDDDRAGAGEPDEAPDEGGIFPGIIDIEGGDDEITPPDSNDIEGTDETEPDDSAKDKDDIEKKEEADAQDATEGAKKAGIPKWIIPAAIGAAVLLLVIIVLLVKRKKSSYASGYSIPATEGGPGIPIYVDVRIGNVRAKSVPLVMKNGELLIGADKNASIICNEVDVEPIHAKIVWRNQEMYLVDMSSYSGTYLGGMRIPGENKLLSGDMVSVGNTEFIIKF